MIDLYKVAKPFLFQLDPENAHNIIISTISSTPSLGSALGRKSSKIDMSLQVGNNQWSFPIGLAAGLDKNAEAVDFFNKLGFGAVEVGTVTPLSQPGNERPRMWRYPKDQSLRNAMGFNNKGSDYLFNNISKYDGETPLGVNIGKNKLTADEIAYEDYQKLYKKFNGNCDYIVINVSSPNTPGLREHQSREGLESILSHLDRVEGDTDLFIKISPDINPDSIYDVIDLSKKYKLTGVIATNTTIVESLGHGGVSGALLYDKARDIRLKCLDALKECSEMEFIGVGGFSNFDQVLDYWKSGGKALQIYSSFIFQGPNILSNMQKSIERLCKKYDSQSVSSLIYRIHEGDISI
jgi:dihydroorotate dehydrogenase